MRAIGYVRVSTSEQAAEGVSLAAQEAKIRAFAALHEIELVGIEADAGVSAKTLDRPGFHRALQALDDGLADGLLIAKLDRLTRSVRDWSSLIEGYFGPGEGAGRQLWSVGESIDTTTAGGRLVLNILLTLAQWEREAIAERTKAALDHLRSEGRLAGTVPRGMRLEGGSLVADEAELRDLERVRGFHHAGYGPRAIARFMRDLGHRAWPESTVRRVLRREGLA